MICQVNRFSGEKIIPYIVRLRPKVHDRKAIILLLSDKALHDKKTGVARYSGKCAVSFIRES